MMTFIEKFSTLALRRGLSPRAVALALGFDPSAIAQWKRRGSRPNPATAAQLADFFGVPVELLADDSIPLPPPTDEQIAAAEGQPLTPEAAERLRRGASSLEAEAASLAKDAPPGATLADLMRLEHAGVLGIVLAARRAIATAREALEQAQGALDRAMGISEEDEEEARQRRIDEIRRSLPDPLGGAAEEDADDRRATR